MTKRLAGSVFMLLLVAGCTTAELTLALDAIRAGSLKVPAGAPPPARPDATPSPAAPTPLASATPATPPTPRPSPSVPASASPSLPGPTPPPIQPTPGGTGFPVNPNPLFGQTPPPPSPTVLPGTSPTSYPTPDPAVFFRRTILNPPYQGRITITIDPGILTMASPPAFRIVGTDDGSGTTWQLQRPANGSDGVAFDPNDAGQLAAQQIDPQTGDQVFPVGDRTLAIGGLTALTNSPGRPARFAVDHLVIFPKAPSDLPAITAIVGGVPRGDTVSGFYAFSVTPAKGDLSRLAANLRATSQYGGPPLTGMTFSSVNAARVFALSMTLLMERTDICWSAGIDAMAELASVP